MNTDKESRSNVPSAGEPTESTSAYCIDEGAFSVTVLSDGYITLPGEILVPGVTPEERSALLGRVDAPAGILRSQCNIPLIRTGTDLILVDIGAGAKYQSTDGKLSSNLQAANVDPEAITRIVFSHAHPDHIWATLADDGGLRFPNATYYIGATEWDFWMNPDYPTAMPPALHEFAIGAQRDLSAIKERVVMLNDGDEVVAGMRAVNSAGHTPGHMSFELAGPNGLLIMADVAHNSIVSFEHPEWCFGYDILPDLAIQNRVGLLKRAATDQIRLLGYHWTYPGVGYAEVRDCGFHFIADK